MHEVDMTRCLLLSMRDWRQRQAPRQPCVQRVHLQVGSFTCVEPEQLLFTWRAAVRGSWLDGAELSIETIPLLGRCLPCGATYTPEPEAAYRSPCCQHPLEEIVQGRELRIRSVDYTLADCSDASPSAGPADPAVCRGADSSSPTPTPAHRR